jgi:hypothetical protein
VAEDYTIIGMFADRAAVEAVLDALPAAGIILFAVEIFENDATPVVPRLTGRDMPAGDALAYARGVERGRVVLIGNIAEEDIDRATEILNRHDPLAIIDEAPATGLSPAVSGLDTAEPAGAAPAGEELGIPVIQEQVVVGAPTFRQGGVRIHARIVETARGTRVEVASPQFTTATHPPPKPDDA